VCLRPANTTTCWEIDQPTSSSADPFVDKDGRRRIARLNEGEYGAAIG
jgi:hypothetical protein